MFLDVADDYFVLHEFNGKIEVTHMKIEWVRQLVARQKQRMSQFFALFKIYGLIRLCECVCVYMFSGACMLVCNKRKIVQMMMAPYCLKRKLMKRMRSKAHVSGQNTHPTEPHHTKHHQQLSGHKRMDCLVRHLCDALLVLHSEHQEIEMLLWFSFFYCVCCCAQWTTIFVALLLCWDFCFQTQYRDNMD